MTSDHGKLTVTRTKNCQKMMNLTITVNGSVDGDNGNRLLRESKSSDGLTEKPLPLSTSSEENDVVSSGFVKKSRDKNEDVQISTCKTPTHGLLSVIGRRREMEDAVKVELGFMVKGGVKFDFYGVYDGHGGSRVAEECKGRLHKVLTEEIVEDNNKEECGINWGITMEKCFEKMDEEVNRKTSGEEMVGSTAVVAVVGNGKLVVANCGDSRAVLSRGGVAMALSLDHKPDRPDELERVEAAGGRVINWNGHRVLGVLATSRSIGDECLKPFVSCKPEVTVSELTDGDEFLILASDGMWDVVSNELACRVVRRCLNSRMMKREPISVVGQNQAAEAAAAVLVELAIARGSRDNISVIVVDLRN
ncbi:highly ABA-induced PP2C gene 3 [Hibiscus trionum]|uniref:protein-serine/threonine phosphatase n=1 Tax=Hibiscus trionum TaxID=183268 RepID=A0A9W7MD48_HIBTR|nr:highly ABA-induced PP2C gene 3 [Hibiscus trionum]